MLVAMAAWAVVSVLEPMLDGQCDEYPSAAATELDAGVRGYLVQTRDHVWLCLGVPDGSYATLDLRIEAPRLARPLNLHASAQLGEWAADDPSAAPKNGRDPLWWKHHGWWANVVRAGGVIDTPQGRQIDYRTLTGREIQLAKKRFGRGEWRLSATISDVARSSDEMTTVRWPKNGTLRVVAE